MVRIEKENFDFAYIDDEIKKELLERGFIDEYDIDIELSSIRLQEIKQSIMDLYKKIDGNSIYANFTVYYEIEE